MMSRVKPVHVFLVQGAIICVLLAALVVGALKINQKLNLIYHSGKGANQSLGTAAPGASLAPTAGQAVTKTINYKFASRVPGAVDQYSPSGRYFDCPDLTPPAETRDPEGVVLNYRPELDGPTYHPSNIAAYGLCMYSNWISTNDASYFDQAKAQADWVVANLDKESGELYYRFDFPVGGTKETVTSPWASAMAQGHAVSVLARMYHATNEVKYYDAAELAMAPLKVDVSAGGLKRDFFGHDYYEEYPTTAAGNFTLNGFMFALLGLYDASVLMESETASTLYARGIDTLKFSLPFYDTNGISLYNLGHLSGTGDAPLIIPTYHLTHISQLRVFNQWEHDSTLDHYISRWTAYVNG